MIVVGIDLGLKTGFAVIAGNKLLASGEWNLKQSRYEGVGMRAVKLRKSFLELLDAFNVDIVAVEEVRSHKGTDAAHAYGGLLLAIQGICEDAGMTAYTAVPVGTIKKFATGKGNASKEMMIEAARASGAPEITTDNVADAFWTARCIAAEYGVLG